MSRSFLTWTLLLSVSSLFSPAAAQLKSELVVTGLFEPIYVAAPVGDANRIFIVERAGVIHVVKNGVLQPTPFLDIQHLVASTEALEMGLLGLVFDPDFDTNGYFYVYYTVGADETRASVIHRFTVSANPDVADLASLHRVFQVPQPGPRHNGATARFGSDGYLYLGLGERGGSQDLSRFLGKLIRIDVNGDDFPADSLQNYSIPPDNPFVSDPTALHEVWAYGLRNPYRFSFDRLTGDLYLGDVGEHEREEINFQPASSAGGQNYGWPFMQGSICHLPPTDCDDGSLTHPIYDYSHLGGDAAVGGTVYRGSAIPSFQGHYFFADFSQESIWSFRVVGGSVTEFTDHTAALQPERRVLAIEEGGDGELYVVYWTDADVGEVYKIVPDPTAVSVPPLPAASSIALSNPSPNPFSDATRVTVGLRHPGEVNVSVFSATGALVRTLHQGDRPAGAFEVTWNGRDAKGRSVAPGVYFLRAESETQTEQKKVLVMR